MTQSQYQNLEAYLAQKWGMKSFFPQSHVANRAVIYPNPRRKAPGSLPLPYYNSFSLSSITSASLALWLDAADATTITGTSPITAWTDKSGLGRSVNIFSGPTYGTTKRNGLNTLSFSANLITTSIASAVGTGDFALVAVWYQSVAGTNSVLSLGTSASSSQSLGFSGNKYNFYQYGSAQESAYSQTTPSFVIQIGTRQSSVKAVYINGTLGTTPASDSYNQTVTTVTIGNGDGFSITGEVAEIMVWTGTMSSTDRQLIESYLAQKWGLQSSLPASHSNNTTPAGMPVVVQQVYGAVKKNIYYIEAFVSRTYSFSYTGADQTFVVPSRTSYISVTLYGAGGNAKGGYVSGNLAVTPGTTLTIIVGQAAHQWDTGNYGLSTYGGGGTGFNYGDSGAGMTAIKSGATLLVVAGGGGGGGYNGGGGAGGGLVGADGLPYNTVNTAIVGKGGTQSAGGAAGTGNFNGVAGSSGTGGAGGDRGSGRGYSGGGGGGYYGGGGGANNQGGDDACGGGGGGSSYVVNLTGTVVNTQGGGSNTYTNGSLSLTTFG